MERRSSLHTVLVYVFAALFAYPVVIERWLTLSVQTRIWSAGFAILAVLVAANPSVRST